MKKTWMPFVAASLIVVNACGTSDKPNDQTKPAPAPAPPTEAQKEADRIINREVARVKEKEAATFPCSLFTQQEIEALAGNPLDTGSYSFNNVSENDRNYRSQACAWSAKAGEGNEVGLWVSLPKHFDSAKVECAPAITGDKISGIGDQAWWEYQKFYGIGTLRVCSAKAMLEAKITMKGKEESAAKTVAQTIAEKVLATQ